MLKQETNQRVPALQKCRIVSLSPAMLYRITGPDEVRCNVLKLSSSELAHEMPFKSLPVERHKETTRTTVANSMSRPIQKLKGVCRPNPMINPKSNVTQIVLSLHRPV